MRKIIAVMLLLWPLAGCGTTVSQPPLSPTAQKVEALVTTENSQIVWNQCRSATNPEECLREHAAEVAIAEKKDDICLLWDKPETCLDAFNYHEALVNKDLVLCAKLNNGRNRQDCLKALGTTQIDPAAMTTN